MTYLLNLLRKFGGYIAAFLATIIFGYFYGRKSKTVEVAEDKQKETENKAIVEIAKSDAINNNRIESIKAVNEIKNENAMRSDADIIERLRDEYSRD